VQNYTLSWSDEFDGAALDPNKWHYRTDSKMWSTQLPANVSVADGKLVIALKKEKAGDKNYTGGGIVSKREFEYGYYEARFKVPPGAGWHTSFWTMAYNEVDTKPNGTQEIDICEQDSVKTTKYSAGVIAWDRHGKNYGRQYVQTPDLAADFHVWGCEFTPTVVRFFFDGKLTHQTDATQFKRGLQNIWLTCIAGGIGGTKSVDDDELPATAEFDYIRFFESSAPNE
jgi:beta-glucanase (GH16 family)